ncbi:MAG: TonB family protein [Saprospiraceae bacterium]
MEQQVTTINLGKLKILTALSIFLFVTFACTQENSPSELTDKAQTEREIFTIVEDQPSYKGGMDAFYKYVMGEIRYPLQARNAGVEGTVQVQFVIERNGAVSNATIKNSIGTECDKEAIRVIENAPDFIAGSQRGRTVSTTMVMPLRFKLNQAKRNADNSIQGSIIAGELITELDELKVIANYDNGEWSGTISSDNGDKLPGVNIVVAGTKYGTVSNLSGTFRVQAEVDQALHISRVGYEKVVIKN